MKRKWRRLLLIPALMLVCGIAFFCWAIYHGNRQLREAIAEAAADDPYWQIHDIEAQRRKIADAENSSLVIAKGKALYVRSPNGTQLQDDTIEELKRFPAVRANEQQIKAIADALQPHAASLAEYHKLKDLPWGRAPLRIAPDVVGTLLPFTQDARLAALALQLDAYQKLEANDQSGAADAIVAGLNASRSIGDEPFLISALCRIACDNIVLNGCERLLAQSELDDRTLSRIQIAIDLQMHEPVWQTAIRGERAFGYAYLQYLKENPDKAQGLRSVAGVSGIGAEEFLVYIPGYAMRGQADLLRYMNEAVVISRRPYEEQLDAFEEWDKDTRRLSLLARQVTPAVIKIHQVALRHQVLMRTMLVCVAAERYRNKHGKWPSKLADLVEAKLITAVPLDPFDGHPLRWKITDEGRVVYSVGKNRIDDSGDVDPANWVKGTGDVGYRLYDPDKRRKPPRPVKASEIAPPAPE